MEAKDNLWSSILGEIHTRTIAKLPSNKTLLVLGDNGSGKTSLVAKLQGVENPTRGFGLEYAYIDVRDEYRDDSTKLGVWVLDGDPGHLNLLKFALSAESYPNTLVMIVASMTNPSGLLDQLNYWSDRLHDHLRSLLIKPEIERDCRLKCSKRWQEFSEGSGDAIKRTSRNLEDSDYLPVQDDVLTRNYGLDMIVCVTKTDYMPTLEKEFDYKEEHFDFIQYHLRKFCVQHGAALFYISAKEDKNCDLLYRYLTHRLYGFGNIPPALVVEKDAVFVPAGWDQPSKIAILTESMHYIRPEQPYREVITHPQSVQRVHHVDLELTAEDDQEFLRRLMIKMQEDRPKTPPSVISASAAAAVKRYDPTKGTNNTEGVLANFFNSLLNKKSGSPKGEKDGVKRIEVTTELEKIAVAPAVEDSPGSSTEC